MSNNSTAVMVTTAPRKDPTVARCLTSIREAGFEPVAFAEPGTPFEQVAGFTTVMHAAKLGVWGNWLTSCRWMLKHYPQANSIITVQDDSWFHPQTREWLEAAMWPSPKTGFLSLYTSKKYSTATDGTLKPAGIYRVATKSLWGACALVWPREVLAKVCEHSIADRWSGAAPKANNAETRRTRQAFIDARKVDPTKISNSDTAIGKILNALRLEMWFADPSPVNHFAKHSTIGHGGNSGNRNCLRCAEPAENLEELTPLPRVLFRADGSVEDHGNPKYGAAIQRWAKHGRNATVSHIQWRSLRESAGNKRVLMFGAGAAVEAVADVAQSAEVIEQHAGRLSAVMDLATEFVSPSHVSKLAGQCLPLNEDGWFSGLPDDRSFELVVIDSPRDGDRLRFLETANVLTSTTGGVIVMDANRTDGETLMRELASRWGSTVNWLNGSMALIDRK